MRGGTYLVVELGFILVPADGGMSRRSRSRAPRCVFCRGFARRQVPAVLVWGGPQFFGYSLRPARKEEGTGNGGMLPRNRPRRPAGDPMRDPAGEIAPAANRWWVILVRIARRMRRADHCPHRR